MSCFAGIRVVSSTLPALRLTVRSCVQQQARHVSTGNVGSPFSYFVKEKYSDIKLNNPGISNSERLKMVAMMWRMTSEEDREPYRQAFKEHVAERDANLELLSAEEKEDLIRSNKDMRLRRKIKRQKHLLKELESDRPKRPVNSFIEFTKENPVDGRVADATKSQAELWSHLSDSEKEKYKLKYHEKLKDYQEKVKQWRSEMEEDRAKSIREARDKLNNLKAKISAKTSEDVSWMKEDEDDDL